MTSNRKTNSINDIVLNGIISVVRSNKNWAGTMTQLSKALSKNLTKNKGSNKQLPGSPSALRVVVNRVVSRLRNRGIGVKFVRTTDHMRTRIVKFAR